MFDFHTHNPLIAPGGGIWSLPRDIVTGRSAFEPKPGVLCSAGLHPWWLPAMDDAALAACLAHIAVLLRHDAVVMVGECGLDRLRGGDLLRQRAVFERHIALSEAYGLPLTIHCVRCLDVLLAVRKAVRPRQQWTLHGFRGGEKQAAQLLAAGIDLSFGPQRNAAAWVLTPPSRRHEETD